MTQELSSKLCHSIGHSAFAGNKVKILIVSFFAESHLFSSSAQNTRYLASMLREQDYDVKVICAAAYEKTFTQDGYSITTIPITSPKWGKKRMQAWLPDKRVEDTAQRCISTWNPDVLYMGAWNYLTDFAFVAHRHKIPIVQFLHDYSILCLRQWLVHSRGNLCDGPSSKRKCVDCSWYSLGWKGRTFDRLQYLPVAGRLLRGIFPGNQTEDLSVRDTVSKALNHMEEYRNRVSLFIAQSPPVTEVLSELGIGANRCRLVPQYIGEDKLKEYPRSAEQPGKERPVRFVYVGRFSQEKGIHILLKAFLSANVANSIELWIISKDADEKVINELLSGNNPHNRIIRVFQDLRGADVSRKIAEADCCVVPSVCLELASRVVLEAYAQGLPVIVSSTVGNRYLVDDEKNGKILAAGNTDDLTCWIEKVSNSPEILKEWSRRKPALIHYDEWSAKILEVFSNAGDLPRTD